MGLLKICHLGKGKVFTTQFRHLRTLKKKYFENIVGKGENASNHYFLHFPNCFLVYLREISLFHLFPAVFSSLSENFLPFSSNSKLLFANTFSMGLLKICHLGKGKVFTTQFRHLRTLRKKSLANIEGKGENAGNQHFLHFPHCFLLFLRQKLSFHQCIVCCLQMLSISSHTKVCLLVKGYRGLPYIIHSPFRIEQESLCTFD